MEEERDLVVFSDEEGNEIELEVVDYFEHEGQEYAVLVDSEACECECGDEECEEEDDGVYIMKVVVDGDFEEFLPVDDDQLDELAKIVEARFDAMEDDEEEDGESDD